MTVTEAREALNKINTSVEGLENKGKHAIPSKMMFIQGRSMSGGSYIQHLIN